MIRRRLRPSITRRSLMPCSELREHSLSTSSTIKYVMSPPLQAPPARPPPCKDTRTAYTRTLILNTSTTYSGSPSWLPNTKLLHLSWIVISSKVDICTSTHGVTFPPTRSRGTPRRMQRDLPLQAGRRYRFGPIRTGAHHAAVQAKRSQRS